MKNPLDHLADLEDDRIDEVWDEVRTRSPITLINPKPSDLDSIAAFASELTLADLAKAINKKYDSRPVTGEMLADVVLMGVQTFLKHWKKALVDQNLTGLVEVVLEGQKLNADEMKGFVRALPMSLLEKIAQSAVGTPTGTHVLMSIELLRRQGKAPDYLMGSEGRRVWVEFVHPERQQTVRFFTDETFTL